MKNIYQGRVAFITGVNGQDGSYLAEFLLEKGYTVVGGVRRHAVPHYPNLEYSKLLSNPDFHLETIDVTDPWSVLRVISEWKPREVYNLAANSFVGSSWNLASSVMMTDGLGCVNVIEAVRSVDPTIRIYQASTSEMYGNSSTDGVQTEETPFLTASPYGCAKLYAHSMIRNARESYGMFACSGVLFNHESPRRGIEFVTRKVTDGVVRIRLGMEDKISLGNLDAERDWGHAKDYVRAQWMMLQQDEPEDFIIATGKKHTIRELCEIAFARIGITDWEQYVVSDPAFIRPHDLVSLHASCDKAKTKLGWEPVYKFNDMINEMVEHDFDRLYPDSSENGNDYGYVK